MTVHSEGKKKIHSEEKVPTAEDTSKRSGKKQFQDHHHHDQNKKETGKL